MDLSKHLTDKWVLWSVWSSKGVPQVRIIFSKRTLAIEEAMHKRKLPSSKKACRLWLKYIYILWKLYKIQFPNHVYSPLGNWKCSGAVQSSLGGCILDKWVKWCWYFLQPHYYFFHQYWFIHVIIFSVDQRSLQVGILESPIGLGHYLVQLRAFSFSN